MRLVNDPGETPKSGDTRAEAVEPASVVALSLLAGLGGPAPVLLAQTRLPEPWPKVVALAGAAFAMVLFGAVGLSPILAIYTFVVSLVVADGVEHERPLPVTLGAAVLVTAALAALGLWQLGGGKGVEAIVVGANRLVDGMMATWSIAVPKATAEQKLAMATALRQEGPILALIGTATFAWLSIGFAAHLRWTQHSARYSAEALRAFRVPRWVSAAFVLVLLALWRLEGTSESGGTKVLVALAVVRLLSVPLFVQGCTALSALLNRRVVAPRVRSVIYVVSIIFGFHALVAFGAAAPWVGRAFYRRSNG